jgi:uncharacterized OB-fold protein
MRDGHNRVCPSCGAVATTDRVTCDHCGSLTALKVSRSLESGGLHGVTALGKSG